MFKVLYQDNNPNIWKFMASLDTVMFDYDLEIRRLNKGLEITRRPNPKSRLNAELRTQYETNF